MNQPTIRLEARREPGPPLTKTLIRILVAAGILGMVIEVGQKLPLFH
jgi:hypothetical protein